MKARADALLHPLRMRIVEAVAAAGRPLTAGMLQEALADVAPATLYRHLQVLTRAGVLAVVGEQRRRGGVERSYGLCEQAAHLDGEAARTLSQDDHMRGFAAFTGHLLDAWGRYLQRAGATGPVDLASDGVGYSTAVLHLDDAEFLEMVMALQTAMRPFLERPPAAGRRPRLLATILFPLER